MRRNDPWQASTKSVAPTLAWDFKLEDGSTQYPWAGELEASNVRFDLEIYDRQRLVYVQRQIPQASATLVNNLEPCKTYRWTVRPSFNVDNTQRHGKWMRMPAEDANASGNGNVGDKASAAHAYIKDFAYLKVDCRAK